MAVTLTNLLVHYVPEFMCLALPVTQVLDVLRKE